MKNKTLVTKLEKLNTHLEYKEREGDQGAYVCFKMESIKGEGVYYKMLSNLVYRAEVSDNYAYLWLSQTIDALIEIVEYEESEEEVNTDNILDNLYEQLPEEVYNSEYIKFIGDGLSNAVYVDEVVAEYGIKENILGAAYRYAQEQICYSFASDILDFLTN